jgi:methanogenic corrinoid protein MtbC1
MKSLPQERFAREGVSRSAAGPEGTAEIREGGMPSCRPAEAANDIRMSRLARTIEEEIIPRLMLAHRTPGEPPVRTAGLFYSIVTEDVKHFATLVLSHEEEVAFANIQSLRARGVSVEKIYVDLLAPTARYLGELWDDDLCSFTDVTVGLGRLQRVLRELSSALGRSVDHPPQGRRVLLLPSPGEQHTFGLVMVAEFFRHAGWDVTGGAWVVAADAAALVSAEWFDVVGFSLGAESHVPALAASIAAVRRAACNRSLTVLVGGPLFGMRPEFVGQVGADGMTIDGREAPLLAESLIAGHLRQRESTG